METIEGNKLIAEFMGYEYFEANVHDDGGGRMDNVYSKVPILIEVYDECKFFGSIPNPDFRKEKPEKWNPEFGLLNWRAVNWNEHIYGVLEYHTSWDWLMPVVEKIKTVHNIQTLGNTLIYLMNVHFGKKAVLKFDKIEDLWEAVIQFIQWYNTLTK